MSHRDRIIPCDRCGLPRAVNGQRHYNSGLCADCRFVLSREEKLRWAS